MGEKHRSGARRGGVAILSLVYAFIIIAVAIRAGSDIRHAVRGVDLMNDDAYYYTVVAENFATTGEMTFDGVSKTNGYHPLWFWMQVGLFKAGVAGLSATDRSVAVILLQWSVLITAIGLLLRWVYRNWAEHAAAATAALLGTVLLVYPGHLGPFAMGMESTLVLLLIPLLLLLIWRERWTWAGLAALLLVLARLDSLIYVVFPVTLYAAFHRRSPLASLIRRGLAVGGPAVAGTLLLMAAYQAGFGHPIPIHGVLRSTFPDINFQPHLFAQPIVLARGLGSPERLVRFHLPTSLGILPVCGLILLKAGFLQRPERREALFLVLLGLIQLAAFLLFQSWAKPISGWYLAPLLVFASGAVGAAAVNLLGSRRTAFLCLFLALAVAATTGIREHSRRRAPVSAGDLHTFVTWSRPDAVWAATDCGSIAFWTGATFINLDGLINGFQYQAALERHDLEGYLGRMDVDYLVVGAWETEPSSGPIEPMYAHRVDAALYGGQYETYDFFVYSHMYETFSDTITLYREQEVWRSAPERDGIIPARTVVFDLTERAPQQPAGP